MTTHVTMSVPANLEAIPNEDAFQSLVVGTLRLMGWTVIHVKEMFGNPKGIPDLLCFRGDQGRMIELKVGRNTLSAGQKRWQERWLAEETEVHLMHNTAADWERVINTIMR